MKLISDNNFENSKLKLVFSSLADGNVGDKNVTASVLSARNEFFAKWALSGKKLILAEQVHGQEIALVNKQSDDIQLGVYALITKDENLILAIRTADCVPVLLADEENKVIAAVHAGWRGVAGEIVIKTVAQMLELGAEKNKIKAFVGPHIRSCCFEIKADILSNFKNFESAVITREGKLFLDLEGLLDQQLASVGIANENIFSATDCTCCSEKYYSWRGQDNVLTGEQLSIISLL